MCPFCYIGKEELKLFYRISNIKMLLKSNGKFSVDAGFVAPEDNLVAHLAENIERSISRNAR
jgi:predicted DsbA family dithiol-disulfide isomerase